MKGNTEMTIQEMLYELLSKRLDEGKYRNDDVI